ncbi:maleylpyruvate isomerase N-terminal domain-containing protein [Lentzea albidocapillata]|uniref:maleylpyruvate isomerase N-terminal domain-containing protein n=1 Tax=Lentzea albidocapillata TaxID=40571 RepID=UPI003B846D5D
MLHFGTPASGPLPGTGRRPYIQPGGDSELRAPLRRDHHRTALPVSSLNEADLGIQVPSTPDWTLDQLLRHAHRWADSMLRDRLPEIDFSRNGAQLVSSYEGERASRRMMHEQESDAGRAAQRRNCHHECHRTSEPRLP